MNKTGIVLVAVLCFASFLLAIGASTSGGGFTSFIKLDFLSGSSSDSRVGGGVAPVASWNATYCGRLGILDSVKCVAEATPSVAPDSNVTGRGGEGWCEDFRIVSNKIGLRRLNWLKRGVALNAGLPDE